MSMIGGAAICTEALGRTLNVFVLTKEDAISLPLCLERLYEKAGFNTYSNCDRYFPAGNGTP